MSGNHLTPRQFLAKAIQEACEAKGMSQASLAKAVPMSESLIRHWEAERRIPKPDYLARVEVILGTGGWLVRIRENLVSAPVPLEWFGKWPKVEDRSSSLWSVETTVIPGLLQTKEYATEVLRAAHHRADTEEMLSSRLERQNVLGKDDPPVFVCLVQESVLNNMVGNPAIMVDQLEHIAEMIEREKVIFQIIPHRAKSGALLIAPFVIAHVDGEGDVAYVDNQLSGEVVEDVEGIARLRRMFDELRADAMNRNDSLDHVRRMAEEWKA